MQSCTVYTDEAPRGRPAGRELNQHQDLCSMR
eukprot:SAG31_NODE_8020_length_1514_cov_1.357639_2_plen_31_part_01